MVPVRLSLRRARSVLAAEFDAIRRRDPDLDAGDLATFTAPLTLRLLALAFGLPARTGDASATTVLDDLLAAQLACLIAGLSIAFIAESIRCAADIVDDQSPLLAWPWALAIASIGWSLATVVGPFETTRLITVLLNGWLPSVIDGEPRDQIIAYLIPAGARWWAALGPLPVIAVIWAYQAWRHDGPVHTRRFLAEEDTGPR